MKNDQFTPNRRKALLALGSLSLGLSRVFVAQAAAAAPTAQGVAYEGRSTAALKNLADKLRAAPRRRDFSTVPFMVVDAKDWDREAAEYVLSYKYKSLQVWDNSDLAGPWPGLMREAMNGQVFTHGNAEFLAVSATHGDAHLALFSQEMWEKYKLSGLTNGKFTSNTLIAEKKGTSPSDGIESASGFYGPQNNNIRSLQRRGAVFIACHDSILAIASKLVSLEASAGSANEIAADLTNNLIPGAVLVPSVVAFLVELQRAGFNYVNAG